jgi:hypothetical protein
MTHLQPVLAHGSGIDDVLLFVVPAVLAVILLRRAEQKARRRRLEEQEGIADQSAEAAPGLSSPPE